MPSVTEPQEHPVGERPSLLGRTLGRYEVLTRLAAGGMASVYIGRALGMAGFERLVAIKVLHPHLAHEREFIAMFLDEARLAARIRHPNVVPTLDVHDSGSEGYFLVMDYVEGDHLGTLVRREARQGRRLPTDVVVRVVLDALAGLSAAHRLTDDDERPLNVVHRDVSPHNLLVGVDGVCRLTDFGVAKAELRLTQTHAGQAKGKLGYMAPEQAGAGAPDQRADLFGMGVVLWEALTSCRLFRGENMGETLAMLLDEPIPPPSSRARDLAPFDALLRRALARNPNERFQTADEFADALERVARDVDGVASARDVTRLVERVLADDLVQQRNAVKRAIETLGPASARSTPLPLPRQSGGLESHASSAARVSRVGCESGRESETPVDPGTHGRRDALPPPVTAPRRVRHLRLVVFTLVLVACALGGALVVGVVESGDAWPMAARLWHHVRVAYGDVPAGAGSALVVAVAGAPGGARGSADAPHADTPPGDATHEASRARAELMPEPGSREARSPMPRVLLDSTPPGAMVARDGVLVGNTPLHVPVPGASTRTVYQLSLGGYEEVAVSVTEHTPSRVEVALMARDTRSGPERSVSERREVPRERASRVDGAHGAATRTADAPDSTAATRGSAAAARAFAPDVMDPWQ
ncbi:MAG: serine/threonine-protein kinase [Polyangiales bacterium]